MELLEFAPFVVYAAHLAAFVTGGMLLFYLGRLWFAQTHKQRYDLVSMHEIHTLWSAAIFLLIAIGLYVAGYEQSSWIAFGIRAVVAIVVLVLVGMGTQHLLKFRYPFYVERRLFRLRHLPRISPDGRKMKRLTEEEEDLYLDEGMQAEEKASSMDYDVWLDETSGYVKIEQYFGRLIADKCPECEYYTLRTEREETTAATAEMADGKRVKYVRCSYCGYGTSETRRLRSQQ